MANIAYDKQTRWTTRADTTIKNINQYLLKNCYEFMHFTKTHAVHLRNSHKHSHSPCGHFEKHAAILHYHIQVEIILRFIDELTSLKHKLNCNNKIFHQCKYL